MADDGDNDGMEAGSEMEEEEHESEAAVMRQFKEALIEEVRNHPSLYNNAKKTFRDTKMKANAWKSVANALSRFSDSEDEEDEQFRALCMKTWKGLRDKFMKEIREGKKKSGDSGGRKKTWDFMQQLEFIRTYVGTRSTKGNLKAPKKTKKLGNGEVTQQTQQTQLSSIPPVADSDAEDGDVSSLPSPSSPFSPSSSAGRKRGKADHNFFEEYIRNEKDSTDKFAQVLVASTSGGNDSSLDEVDLQVRVWASMIKKHVGKRSIRKILQDVSSYVGLVLDNSEAEMLGSTQDTF